MVFAVVKQGLLEPVVGLVVVLFGQGSGSEDCVRVVAGRDVESGFFRIEVCVLIGFGLAVLAAPAHGDDVCAARQKLTGDFDGLILTVNRETVQALTARLAAVPAEDPVRQLRGLAESYLTFAADHANLLRALFEHRMEGDRPFPEDILRMVMQAFALMHQPMVRLLPDRDPEEVALLARMMFSASFVGMDSRYSRTGETAANRRNAGRA